MTIVMRRRSMKQMRAGAFKARCLSVMKEVQATGEPVVITRRGTPVVKVVPVEPEKNDLFGFMAGEARIVGDIESPIPIEWGDREE
jgi:prevent-host-death family protein